GQKQHPGPQAVGRDPQTTGTQTPGAWGLTLPQLVEHRASPVTVLPVVRAPILKRKALVWAVRILTEYWGATGFWLSTQGTGCWSF
uniref:Uncharacterized protein n=1 Tax=Sus scrofa TaxID=9823 RepID=A0A8W4FLX5_PIG